MDDATKRIIETLQHQIDRLRVGIHRLEVGKITTVDASGDTTADTLKALRSTVERMQGTIDRLKNR